MRGLFAVYGQRAAYRCKRGGSTSRYRKITVRPSAALFALRDLTLGPLVRVGIARWRATQGSRRTYYTATIQKLVDMGLAEIVGDRVMEPVRPKRGLR